MRVIAGTSRGRILRAPRGGSVRPTSDRVREAIFDVLGSLVDLEGVSVADLFCGTGALGIEALSRGARSVDFVDQDARAVAAVRANLRSAGLEDARTTLVRADALQWLSRRRAQAGVGGPSDLGGFDLAFADPPYAFAQWDELLGLLDAAFAVLESDRPVEPSGSFNVVKTKRYGSTLVTVVRGSGAPPNEL